MWCLYITSDSYLKSQTLSNKQFKKKWGTDPNSSVGCSTFTMKLTTQKNENHFFINEGALSDGILHIHLPSQHPKSFSIETPSGDWFVLQDSHANIELMPQAQFDSSTRIELALANLKGTT